MARPLTGKVLTSCVGGAAAVRRLTPVMNAGMVKMNVLAITDPVVGLADMAPVVGLADVVQAADLAVVPCVVRRLEKVPLRITLGCHRRILS